MRTIITSSLALASESFNISGADFPSYIVSDPVYARSNSLTEKRVASNIVFEKDFCPMR
jgi:hypothetical protein